MMKRGKRLLPDTAEDICKGVLICQDRHLVDSVYWLRKFILSQSMGRQ